MHRKYSLQRESPNTFYGWHVNSYLSILALHFWRYTPIFGGMKLKQMVAQFEIDAIGRAVAEEGGDRGAAARALGISIPTLYRKLSGSYNVPQARPEATRMARVYLIRNSRADAVKIGYSNSPKLRETTMLAEDPDIALIADYAGTRQDEADLHLRFSDRRIRGEWFRLGPDQLQEIADFFALPL